jgi:hypothetical protein
MSPSVLHAQWDAVKLAKGWARVDITGMCSFYDLLSDKLIVNWMKDAGESRQIDMKVSGIRPEKWFIDKYECAWVISGTRLEYLDKNGKASNSHTLPAEVGDLSWGSNGFYLSYRTAEPCIEKRDEKTGSVIWSYGNKPKKEEIAQSVQHRITVGEFGNLYIASGDSLFLNILDGRNGKLMGQAVFALNDAMPPKLLVGNSNRGTIMWWGTSSILAAVPASQAPFAKLPGLLLAKMKTTESSLEFLSTGLSEDHTFIGVSLESEAMFIAPNGGLVYVPIK